MSYVEKHMTESLKDHELTMIADTPDIKAFYMKKPGTGIYSVLLVFTPEGIGLTGDLTFGDGGAWSARHHYDLGWFLGELAEDYLCSKFLSSNHWDAGRAANCYAFEADPDDSVTLAEAKIDIRRALKDVNIDTPNDLYDEMNELGFDTSEGIPGYGYDPAAAGWLCAVQQRFRELRAKQEGSAAGEESVIGKNQIFNIGPSGFVECCIETRDGFCELSLDHDDREWPNTVEMELTREQATEIAKILTQWIAKEENRDGQKKG